MVVNCISIFLHIGKTRQLIRISDFLSFFCWLGAGHNYRGDSAWVALLCGARSRFAKPRNAHIALQKANTLFATQVATGLESPNSNVHQDWPCPYIRWERPKSEQKKQKILDILSNRNSAPKGKTNKNANVIFTDMTHCIILQTIGCKGVSEELLQMADFLWCR